MPKIRKKAVDDADWELLFENGVGLPRDIVPRARSQRKRRVRLVRNDGYGIDSEDDSDISQQSPTRPPRELEDDAEFDRMIETGQDHDDDDRDVDYAAESFARDLRVRGALEIFGDKYEIDAYKGSQKYFSAEPNSEEDAPEPPAATTVRHGGREPDEHAFVLDPFTGETDILTRKEVEETNKDVPEELQEQFRRRPRTTDLRELSAEAEWIYEQFFKPDPFFQKYDSQTLVRKIRLVLQLLHVEGYDIPYIAVFHRARIEPELLGDEADAFPDKGGDWSTLWAVLDCDRWWGDLHGRKEQLRQWCEQSCEAGIFRYEKLELYNQFIARCKTEEQLLQMEKYIQYHREVADIQRRKKTITGKKRSRGKLFHRVLLESGFRDLLPKVGLSAADLAQNIAEGHPVNPVEDSEDSPDLVVRT